MQRVSPAFLPSLVAVGVVLQAEGRVEGVVLWRTWNPEELAHVERPAGLLPPLRPGAARLVARGPASTPVYFVEYSAGLAPAVPMIETRMMLGSVLGIAVARPLQARSAAPRMVISASPTIAEYPSPALSPWDVVASQISALQAEDSAPQPKPTALWRRPARLELTRVSCRGRCAHLPLRIARGQAHDGKDEAHGGAFPSQPFRLPVASPSRPLVGATRP